MRDGGWRETIADRDIKENWMALIVEYFKLLMVSKE